MHSLVLFLFATCLPRVWLMDQKALDEFVNLPDPHYEYTLMSERLIGGNLPYYVYTIKMTSQKWLNKSEVDKPVWTHELRILVPLVVELGNSCLLIIRPNQKDESASEKYSYSTELLGTAWLLKTVLAVLSPVPFQPLTFYNHPLGHENITGYDIFAYSWWRFMNDSTASPGSLVEFPMVKATVRAMDTVVDFAENEHNLNITRFTLMGLSMGGWISWLTAAVDKRVEAIVPIGMDFLNFTETFHHHYRAYCGWSYMLRPFYEMNITQELDNPRFSELASHVDPMAYNERYTNISKLIIVLSGDEVVQPDNSHHYLSQLEGVTYYVIIPNSGDGFQLEKRHLDYMSYFYYEIAHKEYSLPLISWEIKMTNTSGTIYLRTSNVYRVYSYHADTVGGTRRDFRRKIAAGNSTKKNPVKWIQTDVEQVEQNVYKKEMQNPREGWRGFFIQAIYLARVHGYQLVLSSEMAILPDNFPCPDCDGDGCRGTLV